MSEKAKAIVSESAEQLNFAEQMETFSRTEQEAGRENNIEQLTARDLVLESSHVRLEGGLEPEEELRSILEEIRMLPKEQQSQKRRERIGEFKQRYKNQRILLGRLLLDLENAIIQNPDIAPEVLWGLVETAQKKDDGLSGFQLNHLRQGLSQYHALHQKINNAVEQLKNTYGQTWQQEMFLNLFGVRPVGEIEIEIFPQSVLIRAHTPKDYFLMHGGSLVYAAETLGAKIEAFFPLFDAEGIVMIENSSKLSSEDEGQMMHIHELEHSIHDLFPKTELMRRESLLFQKDLERRLTSKDSADFKALAQGLRELVFAEAIRFYELAKSEILAYIKNGLSPTGILDKLLLDPAYDYFEITQEKQEYMRNTRGHFRDNPEVEELVEIASHAVDDARKIYRQRIKQAISGLGILLQNYPRSEVLRILTPEPLIKWLRLAGILTGDTNKQQ